MRTATGRLLLLLLLLASPALAGDDPLAVARRHFELRDHALAETALLLRLGDAPEDVEALRLLAEVYLRCGRAAEAGIVVERALETAADDPELVATRWEARLLREGWSAEAREAAKAEVAAFLAATPERGDEWRLVAAYLGFGLLDLKAEKEKLRPVILERMAAAPPEEIEGDVFEAIVVERDTDRRVELAGQFLALFPESKQANLIREILLHTLRESPVRLVLTADRMLADDPGNRRVRAALAARLLDLEPPRAERALAEIDRAIALLAEPREIDRPELSSDEDWARMLLETRGRYLAYRGRAHLLLGDEVGAYLDLSQASAILVYGAKLHLWLGLACDGLCLEEEAVRAYARSLESGPSPEAHAALAARAPEGADLRDRLAPVLGEAPRFRDVTDEAGLADARGGRVSFGDVNGDGFPDLLAGGSRLFLNAGDGTFARVEHFPAVRGARGGLFADLDNDGDPDLVVFRTGHPVLLENADGSFTDRTPEAMRRPEAHQTEAAAVLDVDGDGLLDIYLANYEKRPNPPWARGTPDSLWRNLGGFEFEDASDRIRGVSAEPMCGRGAVPLDFDDDGDTDLYVANYRLDPDFLLVNRGKDGLVNEARARGVEGECDKGYFGHGIGPAAGDLNGDGRIDLLVGNLAHPRYIGFSDLTRVFLSSGPPGYTFADTFRASGLRYEETHSNVSLGDVDLDGDLDAFLTCVYRGRKSTLNLNDGTGGFRDVTWLAGLRVDNAWGSAFADVDGDGDLDLAVRSGGIRLFLNDGPTGGFVGIRLSATDEWNGPAVGARVTLSGAGPDQVREVCGGTGTGCQDDASLRFGTGSAEGPFILTVRWPSGRVQRIYDVAPGKVYRLPEGGNLH